MRMLIQAAALMAATGVAPGASALTCAPPDSLRTFATAQAAPEGYVVLLGRLDFDEGRMPAPVIGGDGQAGGAPVGSPAPVPARLAGTALGPDGFTLPAPDAVTLRPICLGPWCGTIPTGETWLLFAERTAEGYEVETGPCGGWAFMDPDAATLDAVAACLRGAACAP